MSEEQIIYGVCKYCGQARAVERLEVLSAAKNFDLSDEEAADYVASETCSCEQAKAQATHKMKLQAAGAWAENVFENSPEKLQAVLCAIKAVSEHHFGRITIKSGKYLYAFDTDAHNDIRVKTKYTDTQEETF